mgnify:CR=1 FL=1
MKYVNTDDISLQKDASYDTPAKIIGYCGKEYKNNKYLKSNESSKISVNAMLDYNKWVKHIIERNEIKDVSELQPHLDKSVLHLNVKLKGIQENRKSAVDVLIQKVDQEIAVEKQNLVYLMEKKKKNLENHKKNLDEKNIEEKIENASSLCI